MSKIELERELKNCYHFLGVDSLDSIQKIRKMYICLQSYIENYMCIALQEKERNIYEQETITGSACEACISLKRDYLTIQTLIRLMHDSYLAILLSRIDFKMYEKILYGVLSYFLCSDWQVEFSFNPYRLQTKEYDLTKEKYINNLMIRMHSSTNAGDYLFTSSLGSIIEVEKEMIGAKEKVKCMCINQKIPYGDLKL